MTFTNNNVLYFKNVNVTKTGKVTIDVTDLIKIHLALIDSESAYKKEHCDVLAKEARQQADWIADILYNDDVCPILNKKLGID